MHMIDVKAVGVGLGESDVLTIDVDDGLLTMDDERIGEPRQPAHR
jgi:hypothetical protein